MGALDVLDKLASVVGATIAVIGFSLDRRAARQADADAERAPRSVTAKALIAMGLLLFVGGTAIVVGRWRGDTPSPEAGTTILQAGDQSTLIVPPFLPDTEFDPLTLAQGQGGALRFTCRRKGPDGDSSGACSGETTPVFRLESNQPGAQVAAARDSKQTGPALCVKASYADAVDLTSGEAYCARGEGWVAVFRITNLSRANDPVPGVKFHVTVFQRD